MPKVQFPALFTAVYHATLRRAMDVPTIMVPADQTVFRAFDQQYFTVDTHRRILRLDQAMRALVIRDESSDTNRFTGLSPNPQIQPWGGLYCALQQQALVNEIAHYVEMDRAAAALKAGKPAPVPLSRDVAMHFKAAIKISTMGPWLAAELSPHNPWSMSFVNSLGNDPAVRNEMQSAGKGSISLWDAMNSGHDASVARGIGLALAKHGFEALCVQTVRTSERSLLERGDNLIFFGHQASTVPNLSVVEAYLFPIVGPMQVYPVTF